MATALAPARDLVTGDQLELVKRTVAQGATADELKLFLYDCQRQGVHPLDKLLHFTKRDGRYTPVTSIDFMRTRAAETGEYAGSDDAVFVSGEAYPLEAHVTVWRLVQGQRCAFGATARWSEYYPGEKVGFMWRKMPHTMLAKCAEALALRKGFPRQLAGLYAREELDQAERPEPIAAYTVESPPDPSVPTVAVPPAPAPPPGWHYLTNYHHQGAWHEWTILNWDAQGGALKVSTKLQHVADEAIRAHDARVPVKVDVTHKKQTKGEAYLNGVQTLSPDDPIGVDDIPF